jgi:hypothetical protein
MLSPKSKIHVGDFCGAGPGGTTPPLQPLSWTARRFTVPAAHGVFDIPKDASSALIVHIDLPTHAAETTLIAVADAQEASAAQPVHVI